MKTVFIINPCAGQGNKVELLIDKINNITDSDKEIYITESSGDATRYVKEYIRLYGPARFIACGGDGTFGEVLNGIGIGSNSEIGIIPIGTGNDFCRNFKFCGSFDDVCGQVSSGSVRCDAISYVTETTEGTVSGYCANMFNIGFDCNVADLTAEMKKKPFISGSLAYFLSIFKTLVAKKGANLKIEIDGTERHYGKLLLTSIANGSYCGGGIKSNPLASFCDGNINVNIIRNISRLKFLSLLPFYMKGTFLGCRNIDKVILTENCKNIAITPLDGPIRVCVDGEIIDAGKIRFEICPGAFNFVVPGVKKQEKVTV